MPFSREVSKYAEDFLCSEVSNGLIQARRRIELKVLISKLQNNDKIKMARFS